LTLRSGQALTSGYASIAKQSRANGNVSFGHSPTTNVDNPNALYESLGAINRHIRVANLKTY